MRLARCRRPRLRPARSLGCPKEIGVASQSFPGDPLQQSARRRRFDSSTNPAIVVASITLGDDMDDEKPFLEQTTDAIGSAADATKEAVKTVVKKVKKAARKAVKKVMPKKKAAKKSKAKKATKKSSKKSSAKKSAKKAGKKKKKARKSKR
jgi:hypothetical protein